MAIVLPKSCGTGLPRRCSPANPRLARRCCGWEPPIPIPNGGVPLRAFVTFDGIINCNDCAMPGITPIRVVTPPPNGTHELELVNFASYGCGWNFNYPADIEHCTTGAPLGTVSYQIGLIARAVPPVNPYPPEWIGWELQTGIPGLTGTFYYNFGSWLLTVPATGSHGGHVCGHPDFGWTIWDHTASTATVEIVPNV